jgi:HK97 gp10 family phage protein
VKHVKGLEKTSRALAILPKQSAAEINAALDKGAEEIRSRAFTIAPRETGDLAGAIEVRRSLEGFKGSGAVGNFARMVSGKAGGMVRHIGVFPDRAGAPGWYAAWVEFGTVKASAQPFLLPAFFSLRKRVESRIKRAVSKAIKQVANRGR